MNTDAAAPIPVWLLLLLVLVYAATLSMVWSAHKSAGTADSQLLERVESPYNDIFVYKDETGRLHMAFGYRSRKFVESIHNPEDTLELAAKYTRFMSLGVLYTTAINNMLLIGMGAGKTSNYLRAFIPQLYITEVELDPDVVMLAKKYFDYTEDDRLKVVVNDGRKFLMQSNVSYDLIMIDAYRGPFVPFHLLTVNFYQEVKKHLKPGGAVVQNIYRGTMLFDSAAVTLKKVFDQVDFYPSDNNVIAIAYDGPAKSADELQHKASSLQDKYHFRYNLPELVASKQSFSPASNAQPLTDDFAPVDSLKAIETHNAKWK